MDPLGRHVVIGGRGFIGTHVALRLAGRGNEVLVVGRGEAFAPGEGLALPGEGEPGAKVRAAAADRAFRGPNHRG